MPELDNPEAIFQSLARRFGGRMDIKQGVAPGSAPGLLAAGNLFAMLQDGQLVVKFPAGRCAELVDAGQGRLFVFEEQTREEWFVVDGLDAAEWTNYATEALGYSRG